MKKYSILIVCIVILISKCYGQGGVANLINFKGSVVVQNTFGMTITFEWFLSSEINTQTYRVLVSEDNGSSWNTCSSDISGIGMGITNFQTNYSTTVSVAYSTSKKYKLFVIFMDGSMIDFPNSIILVPDITNNWTAIQYINPPPCFDFQPWVEVFSDDFNSNSIDLTKWNYHSGSYPGFQQSKQCWTGNNITQTNGWLRIQAREDNISCDVITSWAPYSSYSEIFNYTSAEIASKQNFAWGKVEAKCQIPKGWGLWPAFWMFGGGNTNNEIDIFEFWNTNNANDLSKNHNMTVHYNGDMSLESYIGPDFSLQPHIFTVEWDHDKIVWSLDHTAVKRIYPRFHNILNQEITCPLSMLTSYLRNPLFPNTPMSILFDLAIQNNDGNNPNSNTLFPANFDIDYVNFFTHLDCQENFNECNFHLDNILENSFKTARNITLGGTTVCNSYVNNSEFLTLIAGESINLLTGFKAESGSNFEARIENVCGIYRLNKNLNENIFNEKNDGDQILIFPNPVSDILHMKINNVPSKIEYCIINSMNEVIKSDVIYNNQLEISFLNFPSGIYIIKLIVNDKIFSTNKVIHI